MRLSRGLGVHGPHHGGVLGCVRWVHSSGVQRGVRRRLGGWGGQGPNRAGGPSAAAPRFYLVKINQTGAVEPRGGGPCVTVCTGDPAVSPPKRRRDGTAVAWCCRRGLRVPRQGWPLAAASPASSIPIPPSSS